MKGNLSVSSSQKSTGNLIVVGGFYSPTNQVANDKDNDGGVHLGSLGYYRQNFQRMGLRF